jgi:hypothetical protein
LNAFLFPISRERFITDLHHLDARVDARVVDPGDVFELTGDEILLERGSSPVAWTQTVDTGRIAFDPSARVPALADPNPDGYEQVRLLRDAVGLVGRLADWLASPAASADRVAVAYAEYNVRYRIALVFPDADEQRFDIDFGADTPRLTEAGDDGPEADLVHRIAASALVGWSAHRRSFFSVRAFSRRFGTVYRCTRDTNSGSVAVEVRALPDLLMYYLAYVVQGSEVSALTEVDQQLSALGTRRQGSQGVAE